MLKTPHQYQKTAVLYLTHYLDDQLIQQLRKLKTNLENSSPLSSAHNYELVLLYENSRNNFHKHLDSYPILQQITTWPFTQLDLLARYPAMKGRYNRSGKDQALSFLVWAREQTEKDSPNQYDFYWCIEYDVRFSGNWSTLFSHYENKFYDILTNDIGDRHSGWNHWKDLTNSKYQQKKHQIALFMPILRYSYRATELLDQQYKLGNVGHCEAIQSCILKDFGYSLKEIKPKFIGYFKFRPVLSLNRYQQIKKKDKLYHPVKSRL